MKPWKEPCPEMKKEEKGRRKRKISTEAEQHTKEVEKDKNKKNKEQINWIRSCGHSFCGGGPHPLCPAQSK